MQNLPVAMVTGAGTGIGKAIAASLANAGWVVVVNDVDEQAANRTCEEIKGVGGETMAFGADIGQEASVKQMFRQMEQQFNSPTTLLVNNAAVQTWASLSELSTEAWQRTIDTNLTGCFLMSKYFAAQATKGSAIVNIGSGCNKLAFPNLIDYSASKGGIEMFTKATALDLGPKGIRVNCIAPGAIATERTAAETDDYGNTWAGLTPLQRVGTPQDVANAVLLLTDPKAAFITGNTINVDGGLFCRSMWPADY